MQKIYITLQFSNWHNDFQRKDMAHLFILVSRTSEDTCSISYTTITQLVFNSSFLAYYSSMLFTSNLILFSYLIPTISSIIHTYVWCIIRQEFITIVARNVKFFISIPFIYKLSKAKNTKYSERFTPTGIPLLRKIHQE